MKLPFQNILDAIAKRKGSWSLGMVEGKTVLAVGAPNVVRVDGGQISVIGMSNEELLKLRDAANELLGVAPTEPAPPLHEGLDPSRFQRDPAQGGRVADADLSPAASGESLRSRTGRSN